MTITLSISDVSPAIIVDLHTRWLDHVGPLCATTVDPIDGVTAAVKVALSQAKLTSAQVLPAVGDSVLIGGETMVVTDATPGGVTLLRGTLPGAALVAHDAGVAVQIMQFATPFDRIADPLRDWIYAETQALGARSAVFGGTVAGTVGA
jgi:hypothetical protein